MSKHVDIIIDEVYDNFKNYFTDNEEKIWFLQELIEALQLELEYYEQKD